MLSYYVVTDGSIGYIHWIGEADSPEKAYEKCCSEIGGGPEMFAPYNEFKKNIQNITTEQFYALGGYDCDGCLQSNIDLLATF